MIRRPSSSIVANPVLVGALTVTVALVSVFLSYNANDGLPFVPTYELKVEVPNSAGLIDGNEVRLGGRRVGVVSDIAAETHEDGETTAELTLELEKAVEPLPDDSQVLIRPKSALGLKYVEVTRGSSATGFAAGSTIPAEQTGTKPVELDDFFNMFDGPTRTGGRDALREGGVAFAGRGVSLNEAFLELEPLVRQLEPALRTIGSEAAEFDEFFPALEQAASEVLPVAVTQGELYLALDTTFAAFDEVSEPIQDAIEGGPPALDAAIEHLPLQVPYVARTERLFRALRPAFGNLAGAAPDLAYSFRVGQPALEETPALNARFVDTFRALDEFAADDRVRPSIDRLTTTAASLQEPAAFIEPSQTTCNYFALLMRNAASALSESDVIGSMLRVVVLPLPQLPDSEAGPAAAPADGPDTSENPDATYVSLTDDSFLHSNPNPNTAAPGQTRECEAGNERYLPGEQVIGNQPGNQGTFSEATRRQELP